ncbi:MAG: high-potential iron-sulfur protein [Haloplanus sp.]
MSDRLTDTKRRRLLALVGSGLATGLAGCSGGGGGGATATPTATPTTTSGGDGGVPAAYETATSQAGVQRNPDSLSSKEAVNYQESPKNGQKCSGCQFYIPDKNGDGLGACAIVAGTIDPEGYCVSYAEYQG